jgi:low affinity Fe/Cu permease
VLSVSLSNLWLLSFVGALVATFVIVFTLQHVQRREVGSMQRKLDQILRVIADAPYELEQGRRRGGSAAPFHVFDQDAD